MDSPFRSQHARAAVGLSVCLELLLPEVAGHHRPAVAIHAIGEVLTSQADPCSFPVLQLSIIYKIPILHGLPLA